MYISIFGAILTIGFNVLMIPILGYMACAYATLLAYGSMMLVSYYLGRKHYFVPYQINRIVTYLIISSTLAFLAFYQFDRNIYIGTLFLAYGCRSFEFGAVRKFGAFCVIKGVSKGPPEETAQRFHC